MMVCVRHIGRIGALAVALGVGAAVVTTPAVGSAAPPDSESTETHATPPPGESDADAPDSVSVDSPLKSVRRAVKALTANVRASGGARTPTSVGADRQRSVGDNIAGAIGALTDVIERLPSTPTVGDGRMQAPRRPGRAVTERLSAAAAGEATPGGPDAATAPDPASTPRPAADIERVLPTHATIVASLPETLGVAPAGAAQPSPSVPVKPTSQLTTLASRLVAVALDPLLAPGRREPAPTSPALWAVLAWTRRQIGQNNKTLFAPAPPAAIQTTAAHPFAVPDVTDPGSVLGVVGGVLARQLSIYDFNTPRGRTAFVLDYSWGLTGTALGAALQFVNTVVIPDSDYNDALSREVGFFVFDGGIVFFPGFITTLGNVTTNGSGNVGVIEDHEAVHVWQSRVFGPFFQISYVAWLAGGAVVGTAVWLTDTDEDWYSLVETAAYYDNPWEVWAYTNDNNWPPAGANPKLVWKF